MIFNRFMCFKKYINTAEKNNVSLKIYYHTVDKRTGSYKLFLEVINNSEKTIKSISYKERWLDWFGKCYNNPGKAFLEGPVFPEEQYCYEWEIFGPAIKRCTNFEISHLKIKFHNVKCPK